MYTLIVIVGTLLAVVVAAATLFFWSRARLFPKTSDEMAKITPDLRQRLEVLRHDKKFLPHDFPPLGYTGTESQEEHAIAVAAIDTVLDELIRMVGVSVSSGYVAQLFRRAMRSVRFLPTEDRDRASGYLLEIWYTLGFRGAAGVFAHGPGFAIPSGYGEPLPPGWKSPDEPRLGAVDA